MASIGAFIAGPRMIIDYIRYNIRSQIFAKSLPMPIVIGNLKRLEILRTIPELKEKLWHNAPKLQNGLKEKGFDIGKTDSVVTPVYMKGGVEEATAMVMDLRENYRYLLFDRCLSGNSKGTYYLSFDSYCSTY